MRYESGVLANIRFWMEFSHFVNVNWFLQQKTGILRVSFLCLVEILCASIFQAQRIVELRPCDQENRS